MTPILTIVAPADSKAEYYWLRSLLGTVNGKPAWGRPARTLLLYCIHLKLRPWWRRIWPWVSEYQVTVRFLLNMAGWPADRPIANGMMNERR